MTRAEVCMQININITGVCNILISFDLPLEHLRQSQSCKMIRLLALRKATALAKHLRGYRFMSQFSSSTWSFLYLFHSVNLLCVAVALCQRILSLIANYCLRPVIDTTCIHIHTHSFSSDLFLRSLRSFISIIICFNSFYNVKNHFCGHGGRYFSVFFYRLRQIRRFVKLECSCLLGESLLEQKVRRF